MREQRQAKKRFKIDPESDEENHCDFNDEEEFSLRPHAPPPLKKERKANSKKCSNKCFIWQLPTEILLQIVKYLDSSPHDLINLDQTCQRAHFLLDPRTGIGAKCWTLIRIKLGFPDPIAIEITDAALLKAYYGRGDV